MCLILKLLMKSAEEERNDENQSIETNHLGNELELEQHETTPRIYPPLSKEIAI